MRGRELGTLSVLFTDIVGSTAQRARLGDDRADELQRVHDEVVAAAIVAANGTLVKRLGDGAMATFAAAADAVAAAVAIQQGVEQHRRDAREGEGLSVRVGISIGDVTLDDDDDVFGTAVVEAARLCSVATGDEILTAELVRMLARGRGGFAFEPVGEVALNGLPEPVLTCRVLWEPVVAPRADQVVPLPAPLLGAPATAFVGRRGVVDELTAALREVQGGTHRTVLLAGEPGIGKTRLASEAARAAFEQGATVLFGRCDEDLAVPYQPFVEALQHYITDTPPGLPLGRLPGELVRLVPQLRAYDDVGAPVASDPRSEEYRLFEAVTSWLTSAAQAGGVVLVLDDLHWAAKPTLQMLSHLLRHAPEQPGPGLLTIATYRDTDIGRAHPLVSALADLRRLPGVTRHPIGGLDADDVVELVAAAAGHELDEDSKALAAATHAETEGNPFFVGEVLRHLVEVGVVRRIDGRWQVDPGADVDVPEGVRDVVSRRVARLSDTANTVLTAAAVVGRELPVEVVTEVCGLDEDEVLDAFDEAVRARLVEELGAGRFRFAHALVRTTLYDELSATRARRMHRRAADAVERVCPEDLLSLANHLLAAGPDGGDSSRACRSVLAAGRQALERRAAGDAESWFRQALELLDDGGEEASVIDALTGLGIARRDQGHPDHRELLLDASRRARAGGETDRLVTAVLANHRGFASVVGAVDEERVELIEDALRALDAREARPGDDRLLARLTSLLASELVFSEDAERRRALFARAIALADATGDLATRADVMVRLSLGNPHVDDPSLERAHGELAVALADEVGDPFLQVIARIFHAGAVLTFGDMTEVRRLTAASLVLAAETSPNTQWVAQAQALKVQVGAADIPTLREANDRVLALGEQLGEPDAAVWWGGVATHITFLAVGGIGDVADAALAFGAEFGSGNPTWRLTAASALADLGRGGEARAILREPGMDPRTTVTSVFPYHPPTLTAQAAFLLEDEEVAAAVVEAMTPYAHLWTHYFLGTFGPVTAALGVSKAVLGQHAEAIDLLEDAVARLEAEGLPVAANRIRYDLAQVLLRSGDRAGAATSFEEVAQIADGHGADGIAARARAFAADANSS